MSKWFRHAMNSRCQSGNSLVIIFAWWAMEKSITFPIQNLPRKVYRDDAGSVPNRHPFRPPTASIVIWKFVNSVAFRVCNAMHHFAWAASNCCKLNIIICHVGTCSQNLAVFSYQFNFMNFLSYDNSGCCDNSVDMNACCERCKQIYNINWELKIQWYANMCNDTTTPLSD